MSSSVHSGHSGGGGSDDHLARRHSHRHHYHHTTITGRFAAATTSANPLPRKNQPFREARGGKEEDEEVFSDEDEDEDEWDDFFDDDNDDDDDDDEEEEMEEEEDEDEEKRRVWRGKQRHADAPSANPSAKRDEQNQKKYRRREVFPKLAYNNLGKRTNFSQCLNARAKKWNPMKQFAPVKNGQFAPDWSFHEFEFPEHRDEIIEFESSVGQRRFAFVLNTIERELRSANPELVELVVKSLLKCTNCDVAKTLFRAQKYFDFYQDMFGSLRNIQQLNTDEELKRAFETGALQVFENVDGEGRALVVVMLSKIVHGAGINPRATSLLMVKMLNYVILRTLKNYPTTQKKGFIFLCDMHGLSFEHFNVNYTRVNLYTIANFMPIRAERAGIIRPLLFTKFLLPAMKYFAFASPKIRSRFHILMQDPSVLIQPPFNFRIEQVPPEYGGTNNMSYGILERIKTWMLEEEEMYSEFGGVEDDDRSGDFEGVKDSPMEEGEDAEEERIEDDKTTAASGDAMCV